MSYNKWPKRSAEKNYFMVPNEIFSISLDYREISLYIYLLRCENRKTYQCYPSYKTIGHAIGMSENTVRKYVLALEERWRSMCGSWRRKVSSTRSRPSCRAKTENR